MDNHSDDIAKYHAGKLTSAERHALEKKALSDPFLADALEGAGNVSPADFNKDIEAIDRKVKGGSTLIFTPMRIAAGIALIIAAAWLGLYVIDSNEPTQLTSNEEKQLPAPATVAKDSASDTAATSGPTSAELKEEPKNDQLLALDRVKTENEKSRQQRAAKKIEANREEEERRAEAKPTEGVAVTEQPLAEELAIADVESDSITSAVAASRQDLVSSDDSKEAAKAKMKSAPLTQDLQPQQSRASGSSQVPGSKITGKVTLAEDGLALPGVTVRVKGSSQGAVTDFSGTYSIETSEQSPTLVFSFIGMQTKEASASSGTTLNVALAEDISQLSEVVVTGKKFPSDTDEDPVVKLAEPAGGLRAYDKYLDSNLRYPQQALDNNVKGRVTVQFTVGLDGRLNEFTVMKSLGFGCDEEVIRLVKEGPEWRPSTENAVPVESLVRVRMKFDATKVKK